jgi:hypothetical protein
VRVPGQPGAPTPDFPPEQATARRPAAQPVPSPAMAPPPEVMASLEGHESYTMDEDYRPRRNPARMWTLIAVLAAILMLGAVAAISYFGIPGLGGNFAAAREEATVLRLEVTGKPERRLLESGNELLAVSGRIVNPTDQIQPVPRIRAELRDGQGRVVYSWVISAPVPELQPGQSATFNSAEVDVPRGAKALNLSFGQPS